jgi:DNA repair protein RecN (Recombination protein N)
MLLSLRVKNFAIAEDITVEFRPQLNVITGETGAGKSLLLAALGLILGERADKTLIRTGAEQCTVEALFQLDRPEPVDRILLESGLDALEEGALIIRRSIANAGAGRNTVNDATTTVHVLKAIGDVLVDMHGPHDHQSLLRSEFQLDVLDDFANLSTVRDAYFEIYELKRELLERLNSLGGDDAEVSRQMDMLRFQVDEIAGADVSVEDALAVEEEHGRAANAQNILEAAAEACNALTAGEAAAFDQLVVVQRALGGLRGLVEEAEPWAEEAGNIAGQIQELSRSIQQSITDVEAGPERMQHLETRKSLYEQLKRKYGGTVESALSFLADAQKRLEDFETRDEQIAEIRGQLAKLDAKLVQRGEELREQRQRAAKRLQRDITLALQDLGFEHGAFGVQLAPSEPGPSGMDEVDFGFAPNTGEEMRPLKAIASSGEISRVMLATKAILAVHDRIPILVFDEVDANLGGEMGHAVGEKLAVVAHGHQVLCITHLPQVAVHGGTHYAVMKEVRDERTFTRISELDSETRIDEIARMLGGEDLTSVTREHARQMLEKAAAS